MQARGGLLAWGPPPPSAAAPPRTRVIVPESAAPTDCDAFRDDLPADLTQGFVKVPEDASAPGSETLEVFYYGLWSPSRLPVLIINGGPGSDSHGYFRGMIGELRRREIPFLFFDQRGTGCSTG